MKATVTAVLEFESPDAYTTCDVKDGVYSYFRMLNPYIDNISIEPIDVRINKLVGKSTEIDLKSSSKEKRRMIEQMNDLLLPMMNFVDEKSKEAIRWTLRTISKERGAD